MAGRRFHAVEVEVADPAADLISYGRAVVFEAAAGHDGVAGAFAGSGAVVVDAAAADVGDISDEDAVSHFGNCQAVVGFVEHAGAVGSLVAFEEAVRQLRCAFAVIAVVKDGTAVNLGNIVDELAVLDEGLAGAVVGVVVHAGAFAGDVIHEDAVADSGAGVGVGSFVVPAGAFVVQRVLRSRARSGTAHDYKTVDHGAAAGVLRIYYGVGVIVFGRLSDLSAEDGQVLDRVSLVERCFVSGEASVDLDAFRDDERFGAVVVPGGEVLAGSHPNLLAALGTQQGFLYGAHRLVPGRAVAVAPFLHVDNLGAHVANSQDQCCK